MKKASMRASRALDGGLFLASDKFLYALSGTFDSCECERYNL